MRLSRNRDFLRGLCLALLSLVLTPHSAKATPEYARREGKACNYCHISGSPGFTDPTTGVRQSTVLNLAGRYYAAHNHSFAGFYAPPPPAVPMKPLFKFVWQLPLADAPHRAAVADLAGDGRPELITLGPSAKAGTASLLVRAFDKSGLKTEYSTTFDGSPDDLAVGRFAGKSEPPVIATDAGAWFWNGSGYEERAAPKPVQVLGAVWLKDGDERLLIADSPSQVQAFQVELSKQATSWLTNPVPAPSSGQVQQALMHATPTFLDKMGMPQLLALGGMVGLWAMRSDVPLALYYIQVNQDFDTKPNAANHGKPTFVLKSRTSNVVFRDPSAAMGPELWASPTFSGTILDVCTQDPRSGESGLLVLTDHPPTGTGGGLYFFGSAVPPAK
ncbi:MAG: hypothetical protein KGJ62_04590 [Armatimonadetes bacterium]|nr:hypothetical protein [Armatimonadota bacterium]MDE2205562.1 hypothetical protein [Armatimonadota bacterium]